MASAPTMSDASPPDREEMGGGAEGMVGEEAAPSPMPDKGQQNQGFMGQIKKWTVEIEDFSRQFPAFQPYGKKMKDAAIEGMTRVSRQMESPGGPQRPPVLG